MKTPLKTLQPGTVALFSTVLVLVLGLALLHLNSRLGMALRFASYDWSYDLSFIPQRGPASEITMVYLDEASYIDLQQPFNRPWDRAIHAQLLDRLTADGAKAVVFDVIFSDPGPDPASDQKFAEAIRRNGRVILAADYSDNQEGSREGGRSRELTLILPHAPFTAAAAGWGIAQLQPDEDFLVREHNHGPGRSDIVSLTWATARLLKLPVAAKDTNRFQERWINYYHSAGNFEGVSYKLALQKPPGYFRDRVVCIGGQPQTGLLRERKDEFRSPYTTWYTSPVFVPAVDMHAMILQNLMHEDWLRRLPVAWEWLLIALGALIFGAGLTCYRPTTASLVAVIAAAGFAAASLVLFGIWKIWFPWMVIVAAQAPFGLVVATAFKSVEWYILRRTMEQERAVATLRIREQAALLDQAQDAIMVHDLTWRTTYWNPSAEKLYGYTAGDVREVSIVELLYRNDTQKFTTASAAVMATGEWIGQLRHLTQAGKEVLVESRWTRLDDATGQPSAVLVLNTDITERHRLESQLLRTQRLESIGTLAGGIAHDLNNVLTPILMGTEMLLAREADDNRKKTLHSIANSARRGADMVKQVLAFTRGHDGDKVPLQLKHIVRELEKIAQETFPRSIELKTQIAPDLRAILGNATQLHQVLLNLCVNARDALPAGGRITIAADNVTFTETDAKHILGARPGQYIRLRVTDTGTGIPQEIIDRIFEPFFTTKGVGKGTGLGLSTVLSIVKGHGGLLDVASTIGKGTTFTLLFPPTEAAVPDEAAVAPTPVPSAGGELVLVVDDEPLIRELLDAILTENGYRVITAENGEAGVALFRQRAREISLVMIDMMMPVLDGYRAIPLMHELRPTTKFVAISGLIQPDELPDVDVEVLRKPFTAREVLEVLHRRRSPASQPV